MRSWESETPGHDEREFVLLFIRLSSIFQQRKSWPWHQTLGEQPFICVTGRTTDDTSIKHTDDEERQSRSPEPSETNEKRVSNAQLKPPPLLKQHTVEVLRHMHVIYKENRVSMRSRVTGEASSPEVCSVCNEYQIYQACCTDHTSLYQLLWMQNHLCPLQCPYSSTSDMGILGFNLTRINEQNHKE